MSTSRRFDRLAALTGVLLVATFAANASTRGAQTADPEHDNAISWSIAFHFAGQDCVLDGLLVLNDPQTHTLINTESPYPA